MSEREYAVYVLDSAPGQDEQMIPVDNRYQGDRMVEKYRRINATRGTYGVSAKIVYRYTFMPEMPWEDA